MIVMAVSKTLPRYGSCGFSKVRVVLFVWHSEIPRVYTQYTTLRLENTIAQLSQNTCSCFNSCYEAQYHNGLAHNIKET